MPSRAPALESRERRNAKGSGSYLRVRSLGLRAKNGGMEQKMDATASFLRLRVQGSG